MEALTQSSGNVFADLGFENEEAVLLKLRADLMDWLRATIAEHIHVGQSQLSDLVRGRWEKFSLDMLVTLAAGASRKVELAML